MLDAADITNHISTSQSKTATLTLKLHVGADSTDNNQISVDIDAMSASGLGAVQNRLEHTINNLDNVVENTTSAENQIRDTDMATEMVKYFQQHPGSGRSGYAGQAGQANQGVLSLLQ